MFSGFFVDRSIDGKSMAGRDKCKEVCNIEDYNNLLNEANSFKIEWI